MHMINRLTLTYEQLMQLLQPPLRVTHHKHSRLLINL